MSKTYDYLIFGASGFTGRLVAEYFQNEYGKELNWAVAGRNQLKLEQVFQPYMAYKDLENKKIDSSKEMVGLIRTIRDDIIVKVVGR